MKTNSTPVEAETIGKFKPDLTPVQMLRLGVFGNTYFLVSNSLLSKDLPESWQKLLTKLLPKDKQYSIKSNCFKVQSGLSLEEWKAKNWIHKQDPLGWFQWYCRFYNGRRTDDDVRQIKRYFAFIRHSKALIKQSKKDLAKQVVRRQALLHWGYDPFADIKALPNESVYKKCVRLKTFYES
jgi:hypothetical protein